MTEPLCVRDAYLRSFTARVEEVRGFEFDPLPAGFGSTVEGLVNEALAEDYPVEVAWVLRDDAFGDADLIRSTDEVGRIRVVKTENKGKGFKRVRLEVVGG